MSGAFRQAPEQPVRLRRHDGHVVVRVIGVGGAGSNAVARMQADDIDGVEFIVANTDAQALLASPVARRLRLGEALTRGLGAGGDPAVGARAAQESLEELRATLRGADLVFVTAGMGGGTGTGAAPVIARLARELGALVVAVVSCPFRFEGARRAYIAMQGIDELRPHVDTLIVVPNERLLAIVDHHLPFTDALHAGDDILRQGVRGISDLITIPGLINLDFADVRSVIADAGTALMAIGEATGDRRAQEATQHAVESPLLERDIRGARRILLNIAGGADLTLMEVAETASLVQSLAHPEAVIIFGTVQDDHLIGSMRVTLIATNFASGAAQHDPTGAVTRPLLSDPRADVLTPEMLLGDAWPLPGGRAISEEPTAALPALPLRQAASHPPALPPAGGYAERMYPSASLYGGHSYPPTGDPGPTGQESGGARSGGREGSGTHGNRSALPHEQQDDRPDVSSAAHHSAAPTQPRDHSSADRASAGAPARPSLDIPPFLRA
jgi:cell division protein FtsZ